MTEVTNDRGDTIARIRVLDDSHPVYVSLGKGAEMGTSLTAVETLALVEALRDAAIEAARRTYVELLAAHDWHHESSDDHRVWKRGRDQRGALLMVRTQVDPGWTLWNQHAPTDQQRTKETA